MHSAQHLYPILTKSGFCRQIFIKFHGNPFSESRADTFGRTNIYVYTNRRAEMKQITEACREYEEAPKNSVAEEIGFLHTQPLKEHPLQLLHYCGMDDRPRDSSIFQNQILQPCCVRIRPGCAATMGAIITMDVRSTIFEPSALFSDRQHSHYSVNIHLKLWAVNFDGVNAKWSFYPCSGTGTPLK